MAGTEGEVGATTVDPEPPRRVGPVRRLYDWVLSWAERPSGPRALGGLTFAESSFFPIPPDPLLVALSLGAPRRALWFATIATVTSVLGGMFGYLLGWGVWELVHPFFFNYVPGVTPEAFERVRLLYDRYDFLAIFVAGFSPIPYKVFTLSAGVFSISFPIFVIASLTSRGARFFLVAGLIYFFGPPIQGFIDRYFDRLVWLFVILLIGGFVVVSAWSLGLMIPIERAFFLAALTALAILLQQTFALLEGMSDTAELAPAGILGAVAFVITAVVQLLRRRMLESEALAEQRGVDLRNLAELSEYIVQHLRESIMVVDGDDRVRLINESAAAHLGAGPRRPGLSVAEVCPELARRLAEWRPPAAPARRARAAARAFLHRHFCPGGVRIS
jgi:membrane protein YqaA with SNARE-associated domain